VNLRLKKSSLNKSFSILFCLFILFTCKERSENNDQLSPLDNPIVANSSDRDLREIKEDGVLRALVIYSSTSYFLYKGEPMGFEYELLNRLADDLGLKLELVVSNDLDSQFEVLNRGNVDLIAHGMTITNQRKWEVDFTEYLYLTRQVLVQKKPDNYRKMSWSAIEKSLIKDPINLIGDTVSIRKNSSYYERLVSLSNEIGDTIYINFLDSDITTDEIIDMVAEGKVKYTIADENLAKIKSAYRPILNVDVPISLNQRIAWVTRKKSKDFRKVLNDWITAQRKTTDYNVIYNKYFKNKRSFQRRRNSDFYSLKNNQISQYDEIIKKYASSIGVDWRLTAAQIYQESKFDRFATSWAGAEGLMQMMPSTLKAMKVTDSSDPNQSIRAGVNYFEINRKAFEHVPDSLEKIKISLAAYNCGSGHVHDAQRLAEQRGLNPNIWKDNVEQMLLDLRFPKYYTKEFVKHGYVRGSEPVNYVNQIMERYEHYKTFIADNQ
ncbi:MAG: transporter substrate-binding domain-containing protein, partial [Bacteroidota bacterium]